MTNPALYFPKHTYLLYFTLLTVVFFEIRYRYSVFGKSSDAFFCTAFAGDLPSSWGFPHIKI